MTWTHLFLWLPCRIFWKPKFKQTVKKTTQFNFFAYAKIAAWAKRNEGKMGKAEKNLLKLFRNICNLLKTWPGKLNCFAVVVVAAASVFLLLLFIHLLCCWHVVNTVIALSRCNCIFAIVFFVVPLSIVLFAAHRNLIASTWCETTYNCPCGVCAICKQLSWESEQDYMLYYILVYCIYLA